MRVGIFTTSFPAKVTVATHEYGQEEEKEKEVVGGYMATTGFIEAELATTQTTLSANLGEDYTTYQRLLESFLAGRITKEELEGALRAVLRDDLTLYDLHNKYIGLVLEKLAVVEAESISACERFPSTNIGHVESSSLLLDTIELSSLDQQLFSDATKRELPVFKCTQYHINA